MYSNIFCVASDGRNETWWRELQLHGPWRTEFIWSHDVMIRKDWKSEGVNVMCSLLEDSRLEWPTDPQEVVYHSPRVTERRHRMPETDENVEVETSLAGTPMLCSRTGRLWYSINGFANQRKNMSSVCQLYFIHCRCHSIPCGDQIRKSRAHQISVTAASPWITYCTSIRLFYSTMWYSTELRPRFLGFRAYLRRTYICPYSTQKVFVDFEENRILVLITRIQRHYYPLDIIIIIIIEQPTNCPWILSGKLAA